MRGPRSLRDLASAGTVPARFPRPLLRATSRRLPFRGTPGGEPSFPRKGAAPSRLPSSTASQAQLCLLARPAPPRPSRAPPRVTVRARQNLPPPRRLPTWGTCREMPGRGGFRGFARPLCGAGWSGGQAPPPRPSRHRHRPALQRREAANGRRGGGPAGGCHPPGDGSAETGSARAAAAPQVVGEEPPEEEEEPPSSRLRTTARPGCGGQTPALRLPPRAPDRQHDRRAAPGLLLHRAER